MGAKALVKLGETEVWQKLLGFLTIFPNESTIHLQNDNPMATLEHGWNIRKCKARIRWHPFRDDKFLQGIAMDNVRSVFFLHPSCDRNTWIQSVAMVIGLPFFSVATKEHFLSKAVFLSIGRTFP